MLEGHELSTFEMPSKLNPETKCVVKDYRIANTLFLVADDISETCAARWKVHSSTCDVLVHAHDGQECDVLYKFRLITDQCDAPLVVFHSDQGFMQCYNSKVQAARANDMMPLHQECTTASHSVLLQDDSKGHEVVPALRSALQQTSALVRQKYVHLATSTLQENNSTQHLRTLLHHGKRSIHDVHIEFMRMVQDLPADRGALGVLRDNLQASSNLNVQSKSKHIQRSGHSSYTGMPPSFGGVESAEAVAVGAHEVTSFPDPRSHPGSSLIARLKKDRPEQQQQESAGPAEDEDDEGNAENGQDLGTNEANGGNANTPGTNANQATTNTAGTQVGAAEMQAFEAAKEAVRVAKQALDSNSDADQQATLQQSYDAAMADMVSKKAALKQAVPSHDRGADDVEHTGCTSPVIIDNGSGSLKIGCKDQADPIEIDTLVGVPKYPYVMIDSAGGTSKRELYDIKAGDTGNFTVAKKPAVGKADEYGRFRGVTKVEHPMIHGIIKDMEQMKVIWDYALRRVKLKPNDDSTQECDDCDGDGKNYLLTEAPLNPKNSREVMTELFFDTYKATGVYIGIQAVLALFATDTTTGLVVDIGDGVTHIVPIVEGYAIPHAIRRLDLGGRDLTQYLARMLSEEKENQGRYFMTSAELEIAKYIKENRGYVAFTGGRKDHFRVENEKYNANPEDYLTMWKMPDDQLIRIQSEQYRVAEPLFHPDLIGVESAGISALMVDAVSVCDIDIRKKLFGKMLLSGGSSRFRNLPERIISEVDDDPRTHLEVDEYVFIDIQDLKREYLVYSGAHKIAQLTEMDQLWFSRQDWDEGAGTKGMWEKMRALM